MAKVLSVAAEWCCHFWWHNQPGVGGEWCLRGEEMSPAETRAFDLGLGLPVATSVLQQDSVQCLAWCVQHREAVASSTAWLRLASDWISRHAGWQAD